MIFKGSEVVPDPAEVTAITLLQRLEDFELGKVLVVFGGEVPAQDVQQKLELAVIGRDAQHQVDFL